MPPQRVTSGWTTSTWPRSTSSRKPQRVASSSPAAIAHVDGVGELRVSLELVRLERLLEPVNAELLELARDADRPAGIGAVAEAGVDQDRRRRHRPRLARLRASAHVVRRVLAERTPAELDGRETDCSTQLARRCRDVSASVSGISIDA